MYVNLQNYDQYTMNSSNEDIKSILTAFHETWTLNVSYILKNALELDKTRITGLPVIGCIVRTPPLVYKLLSDIKT